MEDPAAGVAALGPLTPWLAALEPTTEKSLVFLGGGDVWLQVGVWLMAAFVVGLTVYNHRKLRPPRRRVLMVALRTVLVLLLVLVFYQPALLEEKVATHKNALLVVADVSESMALPHGSGTRLEAVKALVEANRGALEALSEDHDLGFFALAEGLEELPSPLTEHAKFAAALTAKGRATRLADGLGELQKRYKNREVGGVVLMTDGIDTTAAGRRATLGLETQAVVRALDAPIHSFTTAGDASLKDVAVTHIAYNNFAFLLNASSLDATVEVHGYPAMALPVHLTENGAVIATKTVAVTPGEDTYKVPFEFVPKKLGKQVYGVQIDPLADEIYAKNNLRYVIINVVRDKIRAVQVVGQPSWDERFMRNLLKENANVDLVSFFILVNRFNRAPSARETSLIPFPSEELFKNELGGFDLIVFQNFNYGPYNMYEYLPYIADFVRKGGALVMVGGPLSMSAGGYYGTPIADVLPVEIPPGFGGEETVDEAKFRPQLTAAGEHHPITRLALDPGANRSIWDGITELEGANVVTAAKSDAVVLLEHPRLRGTDGKPMPLAAVREVGEGRTMVVATDSTWRWSFAAGAEGKDPQNYDTFWNNAIRWLIKDPELDLVKVKVLEETVLVGDKASAMVEVFKPDYQPAAHQAVNVVVRRRGPTDDRGHGEEVLRLPDAVTDGEGELRVAIPVDKAGIYEVEASAAVVVGRTTTGLDLFIGSESNPEYDRVVGDDQLVSALAAASGGSVHGLTGDFGELALKRPEVLRVKSRHHDELWNAPLALLLIAALFGLEWWLRRRYGYL